MKPSPLWSQRGSEWHRWDPHIHAPGTVLADEFGGDWEAYLAKLEAVTPKIRVLGVTDYFCIRTYQAVRAHKARGRLSSVDLIFPNVEMRFDVKTSRAKGINIHLLFSPEDPEHQQQIEAVLHRLTFEYLGQPYPCTREGLIRLGRKFDSRQTDDNGAFRVGVGQFKVTLTQLRDLFRQDKWVRENCLVAVACAEGDGTSGLKDDDAFAATRQEIERFAHLMFSGKENDRDFWLGRKPSMDRAFIEQRYHSTKPCLHGSDAHALDRVGNPTLERYCWLKGDLTFETLRQTLLEPGDRVWIGSNSPQDQADSVTISRIKPLKMPWLQNDLVELNRGLVAIIGERGSGKTALIDMIAAGARAINNRLGNSSFLRRATQPKDLIGDAWVELGWADGELTRARFRPVDDEDEDYAQVQYLSQQFVDRLCSAGGLAHELREEIERVIFDQTDSTDRFETGSFSSLASLLLGPIRRRRQQQSETIIEQSRKVTDEQILRSELPKFQAEHKILDQELTKARQDLSNLLPKGNEQRSQRLVALDRACTDAESRVEGLKRRLKSLEGLLAETIHIHDQETVDRLASMQETFADAKLTDAEWGEFRLKFTGNVVETIAVNRRVLEQQILVLEHGHADNPVDVSQVPLAGWPLVTLKWHRDALRKEIGVDKQQQIKYDALKKNIATKEAALKKLDAAIVKSSGANERLRGLREGRRQAYLEIFNAFVEENDVLARLYKPLHDQLEDAEGSLANLRFVVRRNVDFKAWVKAGESLIDLRKETSFRGHGALANLAGSNLLPAWTSGSADAVATAMHEFVATHWTALHNAMPSTIGPTAQADWFRQISLWLYSTDHIDIRYGIEYRGVEVEQLSPGTRGIVLLLLYLAIDRNDRRPLLIDQPEENLDPKSVFEELVPHFRQARTRRQIIIVTHNANLVVNTDADQVIVASCASKDDGGLPYISYRSGSLENTAIRHAVCGILEGGERAFLERERRYRIQWQDVLEEQVAGVVPP